MVFLCFLFVLLPSHVFAQQKVPILIYHSIDEFKGVGSKELYVTPENFEKQMVSMAQRVSILNGLEDPEFIDKKMISNYIDMMKKAGYATEKEGQLVFDAKVNDVSEKTLGLLSSDIRQSIKRLTQTK